MANDAVKKKLLFRTSGIVNLDRSKNFSSVFSKRGEKGANQDSCVVWEEALSEASHDSDCNKTESDKLLTTFQVWKQSYKRACAAVDHELEHQRKFDSFNSRTTALTIARQGETIYIANVGDSRAVLATTSKQGMLNSIQLTADFKPNLPEEVERIILRKGRVFCMDDEPGVHWMWLPDEVSPGLAMSRAFGDFCVRDFGLISIPEVTERRITSNDRFIVLATDGVWDVISNREAVQIVASTTERGKSAKKLVESAPRAWKHKRKNIAMDDISAIVLFFHKFTLP